MKHCKSVKFILDREVINLDGEHIGEIRELMIDLNAGCIAYAVLTFGGGFVGPGNKLFAVPWNKLNLTSPAFSHEGHPDRKFVLNITREELENGLGLDKNNWLNMNDLAWLQALCAHYNCVPYCEYSIVAGKLD